MNSNNFAANISSLSPKFRWKLEQKVVSAEASQQTWQIIFKKNLNKICLGDDQAEFKQLSYK